MVAMETVAILKISTPNYNSCEVSLQSDKKKNKKKIPIGFYGKLSTISTPQNILKGAPVQSLKSSCRARYIGSNTGRDAR